MTDDYLAARACLLAPLPEHAIAADLLSTAADAILVGGTARAGDMVRQADMPALFEFGRKLMGKDDPDVHRRRPVQAVAKRLGKDPVRMPTAAATRALFDRDGWHCRFCGCRVVSPRARSAMRACLPGAVPWSETEGFHGGFFALSASVDHVLPHSAGGGNDLSNLVTACWPCQFGRGPATLEELGLLDPRSRTPVSDGWDGLGRLLDCSASSAIAEASLDGAEAVHLEAAARSVATNNHIANRLLGSDQVRWLSTLDEIQLPPSRRTFDFLDHCADLNVSWSLNKVLLARMRVGSSVVDFMAVEPNGEVHLPWSIGGRKDAFKTFAIALAKGIPGAVCYETPKLWKVSGPAKKLIGLLDLLERLPALRTALELLHSALEFSAETDVSR